MILIDESSASRDLRSSKSCGQFKLSMAPEMSRNTPNECLLLLIEC